MPKCGDSLLQTLQMLVPGRSEE